MKKFFCLAIAALCLGLTMASCSDDKDKDLGGGVYLINGHRFVDLGLPSGLLWAECNVGTNDELSDGTYFAWAETSGKSEYWQDTYKYGTSAFNITKYNTTDGLTTLERTDDPAASWGSSCRMPTKEELDELVKYCTWTKEEYLNSKDRQVEVYAVSSTKNGNKIYFTITGYRDGLSNYDHGKSCYLWSSTRGEDNVTTAYGLILSDNEAHTAISSRFLGCPVRPVATR